ncbi:MAG TPA: putative Ig domain-containing protein [Micromonosporaceae bacterium]|nr:putative Ig domain-containing protein [Micromonosporaceae bacterium]
MRARPQVLTLLTAATSLVVVAMLSTPAQASVSTAAATASASPAKVTTQAACADTKQKHVMHCFALRRVDLAAVSANAITPNVTPSGYGPADLDSAYKLSSAGGSGETVAIVDAMNDPTAAADLATYRSQFGLPACTVASGCLQIVNQNGATSPLPANDAGWAGEESLDLDMVSAICPNCHIILVEANSATDADLYAAEDRAVTMGAKFVSNSWGGGEYSGQTTDDSHFNHPGVAITVSSGDNGHGSEYPATSQYVTAVGGTHLVTASNSRGWTETAWNGAGSGCSSFDAKPSWQTGVATSCARRAEADVSAVADPATGVAVFQTFGASGWVVYGGTSVAAPVIAGVYALAGNPAAGTYAASYPYAHTGNLFDVTSGTNGTCGAPSCTAGVGWDGPTGFGTPNGTAAFTNGGGPGPLTANNPGNQTSTVGTAVSLTLTASGGTPPYTWTSTALPAGLSLNGSTGVISGTPTTSGTTSVTATVHDSASGSASATFSWTVNPTGGCTPAQLLGNPGFETGSAAPWSTTAGVVNPNGAGETSHSGTWYAWLDGYGTTHTDTASQTVTIPAGCHGTLTFWLHIDTAETTTVTQFDRLTISVTMGGVTTTLGTFSNLNHATGYQQHSFPLPAGSGSATIKFSGSEDVSLQTSFVLDDTALNVS